MSDRSEPEHILVFTMGKVGTDSIVKSLRDDRFVVHKVHGLNKKFIERKLKLDKIPKPVLIAKDYLDNVDPYIDRIKMITLIREPVGRGISGFFQTLHKRGFKEPYDRFHVEELFPIYINEFNHQRPDNWFKNSFSKVLGIDYRSIEFDANLGYRMFSSGKYDVLLMQTELADLQIQKILTDFTGVEISLKRANQSARKPYGKLYKEFKRTIQYSDEFLDSLLSLQTSKKFYTPEQREHIRDFYKRIVDKLVPLPRKVVTAETVDRISSSGNA